MSHSSPVKKQFSYIIYVIAQNMQYARLSVPIAIGSSKLPCSANHAPPSLRGKPQKEKKTDKLTNKNYATNCTEVGEVFEEMYISNASMYMNILNSISDAKSRLANIPPISCHTVFDKMQVLEALYSYAATSYCTLVTTSGAEGWIFTYLINNKLDDLLDAIVSENIGTLSYAMAELETASSSHINKDTYLQWMEDYFSAAQYDAILNLLNNIAPAYIEKTILAEEHLYGSSRLGVYAPDKLMAKVKFKAGTAGNMGFTNISLLGTPWVADEVYDASENSYAVYRGYKRYELVNHLGNVLTVVSDVKQQQQSTTNEYDFSSQSQTPATGAHGSTTIGTNSGKLKVVFAASGMAYFSLPTDAGKVYLLTFDEVTHPTNTTMEARAFSANDYSNNAESFGMVNVASTGRYKMKFTAQGTTTYIILTNKETGSRDIELDNVKLEVIEKYSATVVSATDYSPFGAPLANRTYTASNTSYRFGYGNHEKIDEIAGSGNYYDMGARLYDPRIGRTPSPDKYKHLYPGISPYAYGLNNPIYFLDIDGNVIIDKNGNVITINRDDKGNITGITATNKKGEQITPDPFSVKMINAVDKTDIGRERLKQMEVHTDQFQYLEDPKGKHTDGGPASTPDGEVHKMYINTGYEKEGTRFHGSSEEEFLNATGVHEASHFLNPKQVILDETQRNAEADPNSEYNKSEQDPKFQYQNFETEVLKDELKTREQFPNNSLDQKPSGNETSRERYQNAIEAPKSSDVQKYKPQN